MLGVAWPTRLRPLARSLRGLRRRRNSVQQVGVFSRCVIRKAAQVWDLKAERQWWSWVKLNYNLWPLANKNPVQLTSSIDSACPVALAMSMGVFPSLFSAKEYRKVETKTSKRTIAIKAQLRTNQNANTFAENAWENKTSKFVMSTRKKAWDDTGGKSRVGIKGGKKKVWCGARKDGAVATVASGCQRQTKRNW